VTPLRHFNRDNHIAGRFALAFPATTSYNRSSFMSCPTWKRLFEECQAASKRFDAVVTAASGLTGAEFTAARERAYRAKDECLTAERELNDHARHHGCLTAFVKTQSA
jgi:hypothetical protein